MFGFSPKMLIKMLRAAGVTIKFDCDAKALIVGSDKGQESIPFADIESKVNGE